MEPIAVTADARYDTIFRPTCTDAAFVHTKYGRQLSDEVLVNRGSPERSLSPAELLQKFQDNAGDALPRDAREQRAAKLLYFWTAASRKNSRRCSRRVRVTGVGTGGISPAQTL